jgi:hypothetical protein
MCVSGGHWRAIRWSVLMLLCTGCNFVVSVTPGSTTVISTSTTANGLATQTLTSIVTPTNLPPATRRVKLFLVALEDNGASGTRIGCNDSLIAIDRDIPYSEAVLKDTLDTLLGLEGGYYGESGLYNVLGFSNLQVESISAQGSVYRINLTGTVVLNGVCDSARFEAQLTETVRQFSTVQSVSIFINGTPLSDVLSSR